MTHMYAVKGRTRSTKRVKLDQYETPAWVTEALLRHVAFDAAEIVDEPAAGSGLMAAALRAGGLRVRATDVQRGRDFLRRSSRMAQCCTNPPYHGGLDEAFVRHALSLTDGITAMLLLSRFLWSKGRREFLTANPPSTIVVITERIHFLKPNGKPIDGQFFDHAWFVWGERYRPPFNLAAQGTRIVFEGSKP